MSDTKPEVTRADADALVEKLTTFREGLNEKEQLMLDNVLAVFHERVTQPEAEDLLADFPEAADLLEEVSGFQFNAGVARPGASEPAPVAATITLTTTVTIAASHPWITCVQGGGFTARQ
jgi:hypothetical protein